MTPSSRAAAAGRTSARLPVRAKDRVRDRERERASEPLAVLSSPPPYPARMRRAAGRNVRVRVSAFRMFARFPLSLSLAPSLSLALARSLSLSPSYCPPRQRAPPNPCTLLLLKKSRHGYVIRAPRLSVRRCPTRLRRFLRRGHVQPPSLTTKKGEGGSAISALLSAIHPRRATAFIAFFPWEPRARAL